MSLTSAATKNKNGYHRIHITHKQNLYMGCVEMKAVQTNKYTSIYVYCTGFYFNYFMHVHD